MCSREKADSLFTTKSDKDFSDSTDSASLLINTISCAASECEEFNSLCFLAWSQVRTALAPVATISMGSDKKVHHNYSHLSDKQCFYKKTVSLLRTTKATLN